MPETRKVLSQVTVGNIQIDAYLVPFGSQVVVSSIVACNRSVSTVTIRISIAQGGIPDDIEQYIYYDVQIPGNETFISTVGITLNSTDVVRAVADVSGVSLALFGVEIT